MEFNWDIYDKISARIDKAIGRYNLFRELSSNQGKRKEVEDKLSDMFYIIQMYEDRRNMIRTYIEQCSEYDESLNGMEKKIEELLGDSD